MFDWDLLLTDLHVATLAEGADGYGIVRDAALAVADGEIAWLGPAAELKHRNASVQRSLGGRWATPALIDCHTHLIFAGDRAGEFEERLSGVSYTDIAKRGGGILSTVRATRDADVEALFEGAHARLRQLEASGVATAEVKSGYGLDVASELKMLAVARSLGDTADLSIQATLLAAHTVPPEYRGDADGYVELICDELLPEVVDLRLADAVDAYCERVAFDAPQVARLFRRAAELGLPVRLHADQLSDGGGAELAAHFKALSADHLEYTSEAGVRALAAAGTTAVLLPGAFLTLRQTQKPPVEALRNAGVPIAVATDCNPGTSPLCSMTETMGLASRLFGLTPEECLAGATRNAARALGLLDDRGTLEQGKRADIAIWDVNHPRDLVYWMGARSLDTLLIAGTDVAFHDPTARP